MHTHTNVVNSGSLNCLFTFSTVYRISLSLLSRRSCKLGCNKVKDGQGPTLPTATLFMHRSEVCLPASGWAPLYAMNGAALLRYYSAPSLYHCCTIAIPLLHHCRYNATLPSGNLPCFNVGMERTTFLPARSATILWLGASVRRDLQTAYSNHFAGEMDKRSCQGFISQRPFTGWLFRQIALAIPAASCDSVVNEI